MNEFGKLYTVEDIAKMTRLTSRTIRNYIKEGTLKGKKIGGVWRFTEEDIKNLFDNNSFADELKNENKQQLMDFIDGINTDIQGKLQICTIVDYYCENIEEAKSVSEKIASVINSKNYDDVALAKFQYEYIETESKARFILYGTPDYIIKTLELLR
jgi:excisionase family DNA binding protein